MSKNIVFIPNIDIGNGRNKSYNYSLDSWKRFCKSFCLSLKDRSLGLIIFMQSVQEVALENDQLKP